MNPTLLKNNEVGFNLVGSVLKLLIDFAGVVYKAGLVVLAVGASGQTNFQVFFVCRRLKTPRKLQV